MNPLRQIAAAVVLLTALFPSTGCLHWPGPTGDARVVRLYGGEEGYELIAIPALANVHAYRVEGRVKEGATAAELQQAKVDARPILVDDVRVIGKPVEPDHDALKTLSTILKNERSYDWPRSKGCLFNPGVALRFSGHNTTIDVLLCFGCRELAVYKNGSFLGKEDFDPMEAELAALAMRWFPELKLD